MGHGERRALAISAPVAGSSTMMWRVALDADDVCVQVDLPAAATVVGPGQLPPIVGDRTVDQGDQVEPVKDEHATSVGDVPSWRVS